MCGTTRRSPDPEHAVEWAIAYAKSFEDWGDGKYNRFGEPLSDGSRRREFAEDFITDYTPIDQQLRARQLLTDRPDPLDSDVDYWDTVIDRPDPLDSDVDY